MLPYLRGLEEKLAICRDAPEVVHLRGIISDAVLALAQPSEIQQSGVHHLDQEPLDFDAAVSLLRKCRKDLAAAKRQACTSEHRTTCSFAPSATQRISYRGFSYGMGEDGIKSLRRAIEERGDQ